MPASNLTEQTRSTWSGGDRATDKVVQARVNDRLIYMALTGDESLLEVIMTRKNGVIARVLESDGDFKVGAKFVMPVQYTDGWPKPINGGQVQLFHKPGAEVNEVKPRAVRARADGGETKIAKCRAIYAANKGKSKAEVVALFISQAECTVQGANTYYITCAKE